MKHIKKSKKNIMIGSAIAGTTLVASGVVAGIVLSIQPANNKPATEITMKNVYSIRDYLLRRYAKVLTDQGDSAEYIQQQIQKIKENVDQIVAEGVVGGFPPQTIYGSIYQYGSSLNITVIDWTMLNQWIQNGLDEFKQTLAKTGLPKDQVNDLYNNYSTLIWNETTKCENEGMSTNEVQAHMIDFAQNIATEAMQDDYSRLAQYYVDDFSSSHKLTRAKYNLSYYYDNLKVDAAGSDDVIDYLSATLLYNNASISSNSINEIYGPKSSLNNDKNENFDYTLSAQIENFDDATNTVSVRFIVTDNIHKITQSATNPFEFYLPDSPWKEISTIEAEMSQHIFNFTSAATMLDWGQALDVINNSTNGILSSIDTDQTRYICSEDVMKYMANIFTVDNKPLATSDLYTKYTFQLYVYGYDEDTNQIDFDVQVGRPEDEDITDRYTQPYDPNDWSQKSPDEYIKQPRNYELFSRQTIHYETASETTMMQLDEAMQKSVSLQKVYSEQNVSDLSTALNATIAMATEQYAAGVAYGVIAGVYYAASVGTFGATIASGIAATVGAAACFAGAAMATVSAGSISTHVHAIKHVLTNSMYSQWTDSVQELQVFLKKLPPQFSEVSAPDFRKAATLWALVENDAELLFEDGVNDVEILSKIIWSQTFKSIGEILDSNTSTSRSVSRTIFSFVEPVEGPSGKLMPRYNMSLTYIEGMVDARLRHYPQSIIDMFNAQPFFAFVGAPPLSFDQLNPDDKQILTALVDIFERGGAATDELWTQLEMLENDPTTDCLMRDFLQHFSNVKLSEGGQDYVFEIVDDDYLQKMAHTLMEARRESAQVQHTFYTLSDKILTNDGPNGAAIILDAGDVNQNDLEKALRFVLNDNLYSVSNPDGTIIGAAFSQYSSAPRAALQHNTPFPNNLCPRGTSQEQYTENFNRFWSQFKADNCVVEDGVGLILPTARLDALRFKPGSDHLVDISPEQYSGTSSDKPYYSADDPREVHYQLSNLYVNRNLGDVCTVKNSKWGIFSFSNAAGEQRVLTGIDGFKTYMKTNDLDFLNISKLERTAIFACPAIEVAVSAIDFVVQLTTTIIASTYAGV